MAQSVKISRGSCAAFSWTKDGQCRGVRLRSSSGGCRVEAFWCADCGGKASAIAESLAAGRKELGLKDNDYCIAGPADGGWGMCDVNVPRLKNEELRQALSFELRKFTPVAAERMTWGYRVLPSSGDGLHVRLFYARSDVWRKWIEAVTGLGRIDMLAPAPLLLDPMLNSETVTYPGRECFSYVPSASGRDIVPAASGNDDGVGTVGSMLPCSNLDLGPLKDRGDAEAVEYVHAISMALYGMGRELSKDAETMPDLPSNMKPRRYFLPQIACCVLLAAIVCCLGMGVTRGMQMRMARLRLIRKDIGALQAEIKALKGTVTPNAVQAAKNLDAELDKYKFDAPELADVLIELSSAVKPPAWLAGSFDWSSDFTSNIVPVTFTMREPADSVANADISSRLNRSTILGDVTESRSNVNRAGYVERRFVLKARYDTEEEKTALKQEQEEARRKAEEKAAREAREAAEKGDEDADDGDEDGDEDAEAGETGLDGYAEEVEE